MAGECRSYFFQKVSFDHQAVCYTGRQGRASCVFLFSQNCQADISACAQDHFHFLFHKSLVKLGVQSIELQFFALIGPSDSIRKRQEASTQAVFESFFDDFSDSVNLREIDPNISGKTYFMRVVGNNEYTEALHTVCFDLMRSVEREVNSSEIVSNIYGLKSHLIMLDNVTQQYLSVKIRENNNFNSSLQHFKTVYIPWGGQKQTCKHLPHLQFASNDIYYKLNSHYIQYGLLYHIY